MSMRSSNSEVQHPAWEEAKRCTEVNQTDAPSTSGVLPVPATSLLQGSNNRTAEYNQRSEWSRVPNHSDSMHRHHDPNPKRKRHEPTLGSNHLSYHQADPYAHSTPCLTDPCPRSAQCRESDQIHDQKHDNEERCDDHRQRTVGVWALSQPAPSPPHDAAVDSPTEAAVSHSSLAFFEEEHEATLLANTTHDRVFYEHHGRIHTASSVVRTEPQVVVGFEGGSELAVSRAFLCRSLSTVPSYEWESLMCALMKIDNPSNCAKETQCSGTAQQRPLPRKAAPFPVINLPIIVRRVNRDVAFGPPDADEDQCDDEAEATYEMCHTSGTQCLSSRDLRVMVAFASGLQTTDNGESTFVILKVLKSKQHVRSQICADLFFGMSQQQKKPDEGTSIATQAALKCSYTLQSDLMHDLQDKKQLSAVASLAKQARMRSSSSVPSVEESARGVLSQLHNERSGPSGFCSRRPNNMFVPRKKDSFEKRRERERGMMKAAEWEDMEEVVAAITERPHLEKKGTRTAPQQTAPLKQPVSIIKYEDMEEVVAAIPERPNLGRKSTAPRQTAPRKEQFCSKYEDVEEVVAPFTERPHMGGQTAPRREEHVPFECEDMDEVVAAITKRPRLEWINTTAAGQTAPRQEEEEHLSFEYEDMEEVVAAINERCVKKRSGNH